MHDLQCVHRWEDFTEHNCVLVSQQCLGCILVCVGDLFGHRPFWCGNIDRVLHSESHSSLDSFIESTPLVADSSE